MDLGAARFAPPLAAEDLAAIRSRLAGSPLAASPDLLQAGLEIEIVEHFLGRKWVDRHLLRAPRGGQTATAFMALANMAGGSPEAFVARTRLSMLALALMQTQSMPGSAWKFSAARSADPVGAWWELQVGWAIQNSGALVGGLPDHAAAPGIRIHDYSVQAGDDHIAVEVKALLPQRVGEFRMSQIRGRLETARSQLPEGIPGLVWLLFPWPFAADEDQLAAAHAQVARFLLGTHRINAVVAVSEHVEQAGEDGVAVVYLQRIFENPRARWPCDVERFRGLKPT